MLWSVRASGIILFISLVSLVLYLAFTVEQKDDSKIATIELNGNGYLPKVEYFKFAKIENKSDYENLDLSVIRDRIQKHPYVKTVNVALDESNLIIDITEKRFDALLFANDEQYLIDEGCSVIPVLPYSRRLNYPIVSNAIGADAIEYFQNIKKCGDVVTALKMLSTSKILNAKLYEKISEVDLRNGRDILVYFSNFNYPVVIGRGNEIEKMIYFNKFWPYLDGKSVNKIIDYVDLRFGNKIYLGISNDTENQS